MTRKPQLVIELAEALPSYRGGSTMLGRVVFQTFSDQAIGTVTLSLRGRAKTKVFHTSGKRGWVYHGRADIFNADETLFEGHHTYGPQKHEWPSGIAIPCSPHAAAVQAGETWTAIKGFLSSRDDIATHALPPSFQFDYKGIDGMMGATVEYELKATVIEPRGSKMLATSVSTFETTLPFVLENSNTGPPVTDARLAVVSEDFVIRSFRLQGDRAGGGEPTFMQKTQKLFRSSSVPQYHFRLTLSLPRQIQLDSPVAIPILVRVLPTDAPAPRIIVGSPSSLGSNSSAGEADKETAEPRAPVYLRTLDLTLVSRVRVRAQGITTTAHEESQDVETPLVRGWTMAEPLTVNVDIDIGTHSAWRIHSGTDLTRSLNQGRIVQSFSTYNIELTHKLGGRILLECAGQKEDMNFLMPVVVLPPAEQEPTEDQLGEGLPVYRP